MAMKSVRASQELGGEEIVQQRHSKAVGSSKPVQESKASSQSTEADQEREDREVAEKIEQKRLEHERQRMQKRELFEQQMQQLEIQQMQEEQAMLASKGNGATSGSRQSKSGSLSGPSDSPLQSLASLRSLPASRRNSNDAADLWSEMEKVSIDRAKSSIDSLPKIGRAGGVGHDESSSPSESTFDDNAHFSKFTERFIFEDDNDNTSTGAGTGTGSRLPSLNMNRVLHDDGIWKDKNGLGGVGSAGLGGGTSYLQYLRMGNDDDSFPSMISSANGLRQSAGLDSSLKSDWSQYSKALSERVPTVPHMPQRTNSLVGFGLTSNSEDSLKSALPKLTTPYSSTEIPTRFSKTPALSAFDDLGDTEHHQNFLLKSDIGSPDICLQFQQGFCPRGDQCPYVHSNILPSTTRASTALPLSPGLGMTIGTMAGSTPFYSHVNAPAGAGPSHSLVGSAGFPFTVATNGFNGPPATSNNLLRQQHQQQQASNSIALASKANQKRPTADIEANRFTGAALEGFVGQIYSLCKDQHGCRYLQKKLEEQNDKYLAIIFGEVFGHFVELMTDPFGNYLCQKLLEYCGDEQRTIIVETVAPELVNISLNMHGTRAVQKMIEFLSTPQQIAIVVVALNPSVVTLIKDLNGNHVIQKCLNRFASEDNQFIYNAISAHCIEVATHRHGCCVLQRCIDHASPSQKIQLVREITFNALTLVQDPYGNYVVQYVLDLADNRFTDTLIRRFIGNVCVLSVQKFSSNVMEKCIRVAEPETRKFLIEEMINKSRLDKLLRDSYANYVVQTSLDYADPLQRAQLVECIRPLLPAIRNTPYGKRIQSKLHRDQMTNLTNPMNHLALNSGMNNNMAAMNGMNGINGAMSMGGMNGMNGMPSHGIHGGHGGHGGHHGSHNMNGMNNIGMNSNMSMSSAMAGGMPMPSMAGMNGNMSMSSVNNMNGMNANSNVNGNMVGYGFPGMNNHFNNVGIIGMNDFNPYGYM